MAIVLSASVDWLTVVYPHSQLPDHIQSTMWNCTDRLQREGQTPYTMLQAGYSGIKTGSLFFGSREDSSIVVASGKLADSLFNILMDADGHATRIDLQVTALNPVYNPLVAMQAANMARRFRETSGRKFKIRLQDGYGDGDTCYIGSFKSLSFARIYDKDKESGESEYSNCWRYEVVFRKEYAASIAKQLNIQDKYRQAILSTVFSYIQGRGVQPIFDCTPDIILKPESPDKPADSSKLDWIRESVKPVIDGLATRGHLDKVLDILAINDLLLYTGSQHQLIRPPAKPEERIE